MVELVDVNTNDPYSIEYIMKFLRGNTMVVTMREGTIPPNWADLVQRSSHSGALENI